MMRIADLPPNIQSQVARKLATEGARRAVAEPEKKPKYKNVSQVVDGYRFDSKRQADRYLTLKALQERGDISDLKCEPAWRLEVNGVLICDYVADFSYREARYRPTSVIVEDVKSKITKTAAYRLKKKLMQAIHRIDVVEVA